MRLRVIGIGSGHGDDAVGLAVAERLASEALPPDVEVLSRIHPGLDLLDDLDDVDGVVLVDALRGGGQPGAVSSVEWARLAPCRSGSSHAVGVAEVLALASALGRAPRRLRIVGIETTRHKGPVLSPAVAAAVPRACRRVREELHELRRARADSGT